MGHSGEMLSDDKIQWRLHGYSGKDMVYSYVCARHQHRSRENRKYIVNDMLGRADDIYGYSILGNILMTKLVHDWVETFVTAHPLSKEGLVVEFGSKDINGGIRDIFNCEFVGVDIEAGPGVDVVCDASKYAPPRLADMVVCVGTLEHTPDSRSILHNAYSILKDGGVLLVMAANNWLPHSAVDGKWLIGEYTEWYKNISYDELGDWLLIFNMSTIYVSGPDIYAIARK